MPYLNSARRFYEMEMTTDANGMAAFVFPDPFTNPPSVKYSLKGPAARGCAAYIAVGPTTTGVTIGVTKTRDAVLGLVGSMSVAAPGVTVSIRAERT